ncbi:MAG: alpha/beta hydrolase [Sphingomonas sp.]|uniref:alpha/beta hydrolase n=1 Tax=Sphingomonas sp. TaxID=28214 RepID=UPI001AC5D720|nr:alpha/beta hydrolase [Sphingomonas sp.]MBN8814458.1 alpha/beta hydrolase [Sphingomonas sp.]
MPSNDTFAPLTWAELTSRPRPSPQAKIAYGPDSYQKVDVWLPGGRGPYRVVLMVHGGCWTTSIADCSLMDWAASDLRDAGYAVWNIDYRGVDRPGGGYPGTFLDAAAATDLLRDNAATFDLDLSCIVAVGHSAGGHLALWLAARRKLPVDSPLCTPDPLPIARAICLGGLPDLEAAAASPDNGCGVDVVGQLVGSERADPYADTSVPLLFPLGVPQDLVNGREDAIIPYRLATDYVAQANGEATLHTVANTGHVELIAPGSAAWAQTKHLVAAAFRD